MADQAAMPEHDGQDLLDRIRSCRLCQVVLDPRPVLQLGTGARILIVSQAPGRRVHETGVPWNDASGDRLREWTGLDRCTFYDADKVALVPMGLCYPGRGAGADLPPRRECAPLWHAPIMARLPGLSLTLLVGQYAQDQHLPQTRRWSVTQRVRAFDTLASDCIALPHPSWRSTGWMQRHPWFAQDILPRLRRRVAQALADDAAKNVLDLQSIAKDES